MTNSDHFKPVFAMALAEIKGADTAEVASIYSALVDNTGDPRKQAKALVECLGAAGWRWAPYTGPLERESHYKEMAKAFAQSIESITFALERRDQLLEVTPRRPYWQLRADNIDETPQRCRELDGTIKHFEDPFWEDHLPPCDSFFCRCKVFSLNERDAERLGGETKNESAALCQASWHTSSPTQEP